MKPESPEPFGGMPEESQAWRKEIDWDEVDLESVETVTEGVNLETAENFLNECEKTNSVDEKKLNLIVKGLEQIQRYNVAVDREDAKKVGTLIAKLNALKSPTLH